MSTSARRLIALQHSISRPYDLHGVSDVTRLLDAVDRGEPQAAEELLPLVYEELRKLASSKMARQKPGQTLQATALVHEAYLRLIKSENRKWENRRHFFLAAAEAMRHILIERARRKESPKHGGGQIRVDLDRVDTAIDSQPEILLMVHEALERLAEEDSDAAQFVKLRYFAGLQHREIAEILGVSERTVKRLWVFARAWLYQEIRRQI